MDGKSAKTSSQGNQSQKEREREREPKRSLREFDTTAIDALYTAKENINNCNGQAKSSSYNPLALDLKSSSDDSQGSSKSGEKRVRILSQPIDAELDGILRTASKSNDSTTRELVDILNQLRSTPQLEQKERENGTGNDSCAILRQMRVFDDPDRALAAMAKAGGFQSGLHSPHNLLLIAEGQQGVRKPPLAKPPLGNKRSVGNKSKGASSSSAGGPPQQKCRISNTVSVDFEDNAQGKPPLVPFNLQQSSPSSSVLSRIEDKIGLDSDRSNQQGSRPSNMQNHFDDTQGHEETHNEHIEFYHLKSFKYLEKNYKISLIKQLISRFERTSFTPSNITFTVTPKNQHNRPNAHNQHWGVDPTGDSTTMEMDGPQAPVEDAPAAQFDLTADAAGFTDDDRLNAMDFKIDMDAGIGMGMAMGADGQAPSSSTPYFFTPHPMGLGKTFLFDEAAMDAAVEVVYLLAINRDGRVADNLITAIENDDLTLLNECAQIIVNTNSNSNNGNSNNGNSVVAAGGGGGCGGGG